MCGAGGPLSDKSFHIWSVQVSGYWLNAAAARRVTVIDDSGRTGRQLFHIWTVQSRITAREGVFLRHDERDNLKNLIQTH